MVRTRLRYAALALCGATFGVAGHFAGLEDYILSAVAFALLALLLGVARDRLAVEIEKVDRLSLHVLELTGKCSPAPIAGLQQASPAQIRTPPPQIPALPPGARIATINSRPGIIFSDGTVIVHTLAGYRQFPSEADALFFFGAAPA